MRSFNTDVSTFIRKMTRYHLPTPTQPLRYCALFSATQYDSGLARYQTIYKCPKCTTLFCLAIQSEFRKNFWSVWHYKRNLRPRKKLEVQSNRHVTVPIVDDSGNGNARTRDDMTDVASATPAGDTVLDDGGTSSIHTDINCDTNEMEIYT